MDRQCFDTPVWLGGEDKDQTYVTFRNDGSALGSSKASDNYMNSIYFKAIYERKYIRGIDENDGIFGYRVRQRIGSFD